MSYGFGFRITAFRNDNRRLEKDMNNELSEKEEKKAADELKTCEKCLYQLKKDKQSSELFCLIRKEMITAIYWKTTKNCADYVDNHPALSDDNRISMAHEIRQDKAENRRLNLTIKSNWWQALVSVIIGCIIGNFDRIVIFLKGFCKHN
jgi:hypothetical protein